ncbi:MAG: hypothetical protein HXY50_03550 [Ignavibacteriaceae bacterium]|nr:hypothetical protein [Ignavibacteriaceae bacterium]
MQKRFKFTFYTALLILITLVPLAAQDAEEDSTGLPGDNFSLQGALEMFKKANSPEEFEKLINTKDNNVNNLDLNEDGDVDYVKVIGKKEGDVHAFVLQVPVSETENQDIAVIELEKTGEESAVLQIIGDEDIYGEQTIVEPSEEEQEEKGEGADTEYIISKKVVVVNVWLWPSVRFVYRPGYVVWVSPWRWKVYPGWWRPWRPLAWRVFHPLRWHYHRHYAVVKTHRVVRAHKIYAPTRITSVTVHRKHSANVKHYRTTRTTTVKTNKGTVKVKTTKKKTVVKKRR